MSAEIEQATGEVLEACKRLAALRREQPPEPFSDHELKNREGGTVRISELFGEKEDLIVVHNMGKECPYCTMWADGFNGMLPHLEDRAAFVVVSPDAPETQREFAKRRGWRFRMFSSEGSGFTGDAGYERDGKPWPGVSTFRKNEAGEVERVAHTPFGPGDLYNPGWHLFDLLAGGPKGWQPEFDYGK